MGAPEREVRSGSWCTTCRRLDILLQKLRWYRLGGQTSDRQWRDVLGLLLVQAGSLDADYPHAQCREAGVSDLLPLALTQVAPG